MAWTNCGEDGCGGKRFSSGCRWTAVFVMLIGIMTCVIVSIGLTILYNAPEKGDAAGMHCVSGPCKNGGTCSESGSTYVCQCPKGHVGRDCQTPNPCAYSTCRNGGNCSLSEDTFVCRCPQGYSGTLCDIEQDPCEPNPCKNSGTCSQVGGGYRCSCTSGFLGNACQKDDPCLPNPCKNSGTCSVSGDKFYCSCPPSHVGTLCESDKTHQKALEDNKLQLDNILILVCVLLGIVVMFIVGMTCVIWGNWERICQN